MAVPSTGRGTYVILESQNGSCDCEASRAQLRVFAGPKLRCTEWYRDIWCHSLAFEVSVAPCLVDSDGQRDPVAVTDLDSAPRDDPSRRLGSHDRRQLVL